MGIEHNAASFLARAHSQGVAFDRCATLGHLSLYIESPEALTAAMRAGGVDLSIPDAAAITQEPGGWADGLFRHLGATELVSIDASGWEGATVVHDLNRPVPPEMKDRFTVVIDSGTLEHVFDFPTAIRNCMEMVEVGGHLLLMTPSNNEAGHGFYQFSPELLFRVLSPDYGYSVVEMLLLEPGRDDMARWRRALDPAAVGQRAQFVSRLPTYLYVVSHREGPVPAFDPAPQQSDYVSGWAGQPKYRPYSVPSRPVYDRARQAVPSIVRRSYHLAGRPYRSARRRLVGEPTRSLYDTLWKRDDYRRLPKLFPVMPALKPGDPADGHADTRPRHIDWTLSRVLVGPTLVLIGLVAVCVAASTWNEHDAFQDWQGWAIAAVLTGAYYVLLDGRITGGRYIQALWNRTRLAVCVLMTIGVLVAAELHPHDGFTGWQGLGVAVLIVAMYLLATLISAERRRLRMRRQTTRV